MGQAEDRRGGADDSKATAVGWSQEHWVGSSWPWSLSSHLIFSPNGRCSLGNNTEILNLGNYNSSFSLGVYHVQALLQVHKCHLRLALMSPHFTNEEVEP